VPLEAPNGTPLADVIFGVLDALGVEALTRFDSTGEFAP